MKKILIPYVKGKDAVEIYATEAQAEAFKLGLFKYKAVKISNGAEFKTAFCDDLTAQ